MAILTSYKVNSYRRICDICGRPRQIEDIRFSENVAICRLHPEFRTAQQLNKLNSRVRAPRLLPVPQPKPFAPVDTWTAEEAQVFNFVTTTAPFDTVNVTANGGAVTGGRSLDSLCWALIYLTGLLAEGKRPAAWLTRAKTVAMALAETLMSFQQPSTLPRSIIWGAFDPHVLDPTQQSDHYFSLHAGLGCAALCRLYAVVRDDRYLAAAKLAAGFIVSCQSGQQTTAAVFPPVHEYGPPTRGYDDDNEAWLTGIYPAGLTCLWALSLLKAITGDVVIGPTSGTKFSGNPSRLISVSMAQMRAFWTNGASGVNGLSAATPYEYFQDATGTWTNNTAIPAEDWFTGVFALAEVDGVSTQVSALWDYARTLAGNSLTLTLAPPVTFNGATGAGTSAFYDWSVAGLLAKATASRDRAALKTIKDTVGVPRARFAEATPRSGDYLYLGPLGRSTAAFLPFTATNQRLQSVIRASQVGLLYRQQPQGFTGRGH